MNNFLGAIVVPHPPIVVPEIGKGKEKEAQATIDGLRAIATHVHQLRPQAIVCITPHGNVFSDGICIVDKEQLTGSFANFGNASVEISKNVNQQLLAVIKETFENQQIPSVFMNTDSAELYQVNTDLDHGCLVPLYYIDQEYRDYEIVHISVGRLSFKELYEVGMVLRQAILQSGVPTLVMASGDLSHTLKEEGPYGHEAVGPEFDKAIVDAFTTGDFKQIFTIPDNVIGPAATCAMESIIMTLGLFEGEGINSELISYEGPFGVGYMNARLSEAGKPAASLLEKVDLGIYERHESRKQAEDGYIQLARAAINEWVNKEQELSWGSYANQLEDVQLRSRLGQEQAGVFVSLHKQGQLRGCIGTIEPTTDSIAEEIIRNAIAAASEDPRFAPVKIQELLQLDIKVDILHPSEAIDRKSQLDIERYGVIVEKEDKRGLLLPNIEGINSIEEQVAIARQKAGIGPDETVKMFRFEVERHQVI